MLCAEAAWMKCSDTEWALLIINSLRSHQKNKNKGKLCCPLKQDVYEGHHTNTSAEQGIVNTFRMGWLMIGYDDTVMIFNG